MWFWIILSVVVFLMVVAVIAPRLMVALISATPLVLWAFVTYYMFTNVYTCTNALGERFLFMPIFLGLSLPPSFMALAAGLKYLVAGENEGGRYTPPQIVVTPCHIFGDAARQLRGRLDRW